jgi:heptosyltransferase-2
MSSTNVKLNWLESSLVRALIAVENATLALLAFVLFRRSRDVQPKTILLLRSARLGDFIVTIPALVLLRRTYPTARIVLLTTTSTNADMQAATLGYTDASGTMPWLALAASLIDEMRVFSMHSRLQGLREVREHVHAVQPDLVFLLPFSAEDGINRAAKMIFLWLGGVRRNVFGYRVRTSIRFLTGLQYRAGMFEHQVWGPLRALMECDGIPRIDATEVEFDLSIAPAVEQWVADLWAQQGWQNRRVVALFPGGTFMHKRWEVDNFAHVCHALCAEADLAFVILGAAGEQDICSALHERLGQEAAINLAGRTSIEQMAAILTRCSLFLGNDSGPAHIAAATSLRCVTLTSGIEYPGWWEPWNSQAFAVRHAVECSPCFSYQTCPLGTQACIRQIDVTRVINLCRRALGASTAHAYPVP